MGLINAAGSNNISSMDILAAGKGNIQKESLSETFSQLVQDKKEEYFTKVKNGGFEPSYQIGADSYTETEWKKLLLYFDAAEEKMRQEVEKTKNKVQEENKIKDSDEDDESDESGQNGVDMLMARFNTMTCPSIKHIQNPDKVLGIGFLNSPDSKISYGMRAQYSEDSTPDSPIIKVTVQTGGPEKVHYIDINHVDARNAAEIEMFALCCYADDTGKGTGGKFGTWQTLNYYRTNASDIGEFELTNSTDNYLSLRQNWLLMVEQMRKLYINAGSYKQSADGDLLLKLFA